MSTGVHYWMPEDFPLALGGEISDTRGSFFLVCLLVWRGERWQKSPMPPNWG